MKSQFTPGPWHLGYNKHDASIHNGVTIASVCDDATHWKANARLIASAPELLAALEAITKAYVELIKSDYPPSWNAEKDDEVISARAIIAKAKGN